MAVRVAGMARGGSGVSPQAADTYVDMLAAGVHPIVPLVGSVTGSSCPGPRRSRRLGSRRSARRPRMA
jgi:histidine ammonia-lyase